MRTLMFATLFHMCFIAIAWAEEPIYSDELIFPLEDWHNHGSAIVVCPNGDKLVCWFHGSGERRSDDVLIRGARLIQKTGEWTEPFLMADAPGFPDTNCTMIIDQNGQLWLFWPTIQANLWESALMKYKTSTDYMSPAGPPEWDLMRVLHIKPGEEFEAKVRAKTADYIEVNRQSRPRRRWKQIKRTNRWAAHNYEQAADKLTRRIGWFTRAHPKILDDGRLLLGLYSDGFSFSLVAITDDLGDSWQFSDPIVGGGNIQPSFARKMDGTIVAYMRDNGPAPKKVHVSESKDRGETWSTVYDHPQLNNPGSGLELANLQDGDWICVYNDEPAGRHSLAVSISDDEGATWKWTRHLERRGRREGSFHYPSIIQDDQGMLHVSYSYFEPKPEGGEGKAIKYATFNKAWVLAGDPD